MILITGASSGIGAALAEYYAREGVTLALTGRNGDRLSETAARCNAKGARCHLTTLDVRDSASLMTWISAIDAECPIDLAILNAGLAATRATPDDGENPEEMLAQIETNLGGTLIAAQAIAERMVRRRRGHLAFVSSLNGLFPVVQAPTYSATKAGILAYAAAIRDWLEPAGVCVTTICPGFVRTAIADRYVGPRPLEISAERAASKIAVGLALHRRRIDFPLALVVSVYLGKFVPNFVRRRFLSAYTAQLRPLGADGGKRPTP